MLYEMDPRVVSLQAELTRVRADFEAALDSVPADRLVRAPAGQWTPAQIVWHCAKVERGIARMIEAQDAAIPATATVPPGPSPKTILTLLDQFPFLDRTQKLVAPVAIAPPEEVDLAAERSRWTDGRTQLIDAMRVSGPRLTLWRHDHPFFGPFDGWQWVLMVARHEERHLLQLREVVAATA